MNVFLHDVSLLQGNCHTWMLLASDLKHESIIGSDILNGLSYLLAHKTPPTKHGPPGCPRWVSCLEQNVSLYHCAHRWWLPNRAGKCVTTAAMSSLPNCKVLSRRYVVQHVQCQLLVQLEPNFHGNFIAPTTSLSPKYRISASETIAIPH